METKLFGKIKKYDLIPVNVSTGALISWNENLKNEDLFGFKIPDFQRPPVWTQQQEIKLIESLWEGIPVGFYVVTIWPDDDSHNGFIIDGQQRLRALFNYVNDKFPVKNYYWSELTKTDQRIFKQFPFPKLESHVKERDLMVEIYNRLNFAGTSYTLEQFVKN